MDTRDGTGKDSAKLPCGIGTYNPGMDQIIFRYPGQVFVGLATRKADGTLNHEGFTLLNLAPKIGDTLFERPVAEVLTEEPMLKDLARRALVEKMEAVAVLGKKS
jgi:hypothetical protein